MDDGNPLLRLLLLIGFIILDAVFYGFGAAIQNMNTNDLEKEMENGNGRAGKLLHIGNKPGRFVNTIHLTSNLIGMITGALVLGHMSQFFVFNLTGMELLPKVLITIGTRILAALLLIILMISFGIVIPKRCATRNPEGWAYRLLPCVSLVMLLLLPLIWLVNGMSYTVLRLFGIDPTLEHDNVTEEDIMSMVNEGHEQGVLEASEAEMITNIFELDNKEAGDIMTHRKSIVALDGTMSLRESVDFILKEGYNSRYPVFEKDADDIIGILHMKDALIFAENKDYLAWAVKDIPGLLREAHFIPETRNINSLFKEMQSQKIHMEVVVDEYGQTAGIVTMEDILEEIVGNILDEYDMDEEFIAKSEDGTYVMSGMTPLDDAAKTLGIEFENEEYDSYDTVNGFLISKLDRIPQEDENSEVICHGYCFKILQVENKMIHTVRVSRVEETDKKTKEGAEEDQITGQDTKEED